MLGSISHPFPGHTIVKSRASRPKSPILLIASSKAQTLTSARLQSNTTDNLSSRILEALTTSISKFLGPLLQHSLQQRAHADFQHLALSLENPFINAAVPLQDVTPAEINRKFSHSNSFGLCNRVDVVPPLNQGVSWSINSNAPPSKTNFEFDFFDDLQLFNLFPENNDKTHSMDLLVEKKPSWDGSLDLSHGSVGEMDIDGNLNPQSPMNVKNLPVDLGIPTVAAFPFPVHSHPPTISSHHQNSFSTQAPMSLDAVGSQFLLNPTGCVGAFDTSSQNASQSWNDFCTHSHTLPVNRGPINSITELDDNEREIHRSNHSTLSQSQNSDAFYAQATADGNIDMEICLAPRSSIPAGDESQEVFMSVFRLRVEPEELGDLTTKVKRYFILHLDCLLIRDRKRRVLKKIEKGNNSFGRTGALRCEPCRKRKIKV